jgi:hypothetical protein
LAEIVENFTICYPDDVFCGELLLSKTVPFFGLPQVFLFDDLALFDDTRFLLTLKILYVQVPLMLQRRRFFFDTPISDRD